MGIVEELEKLAEKAAKEVKAAIDSGKISEPYKKSFVCIDCHKKTKGHHNSKRCAKCKETYQRRYQAEYRAANRDSTKQTFKFRRMKHRLTGEEREALKNDGGGTTMSYNEEARTLDPTEGALRELLITTKIAEYEARKTVLRSKGIRPGDCQADVACNMLVENGLNPDDTSADTTIMRAVSKHRMSLNIKALLDSNDGSNNKEHIGGLSCTEDDELRLMPIKDKKILSRKGMIRCPS